MKGDDVGEIYVSAGHGNEDEPAFRRKGKSRAIWGRRGSYFVIFGTPTAMSPTLG